MTFKDLGLSEALLNALDNEGYHTPTPIQAQSIPPILSRKDVLGCAQTGTGKTAAFALPILQILSEIPAPKTQMRFAKPIRALILTPTRELALQIGESFTSYGAKTRLRNTVIFGGVGQKPQTDALRAGTDILVATPGRLLDLIGQGFVDLKHLELFVLDEADRMLDMGFVHDVKRIIAQLPKQRQSLFFSATMATEIMALADTILITPTKVAVTPVSTTAETIQQAIYFVEKTDKKFLLVHLLKTQNIPTVLIFTRTKHGANRLVQDLHKAGITAEAIHGNKSQQARQNALAKFKDRAIVALVATDIAARGIDIDELTHVVNYELPNIPETYVHRIGRTGRAGASGMAISFCDSEERAYLRDIQRLIRIEIPVVQKHEYESEDCAPITLNAPAKAAPQKVAKPAPRQQSNQRPNQQERQQPQSNQRPNVQPQARPAARNERPERTERPMERPMERPQQRQERPNPPSRFNNERSVPPVEKPWENKRPKPAATAQPAGLAAKSKWPLLDKIVWDEDELIQKPTPKPIPQPEKAIIKTQQPKVPISAQDTKDEPDHNRKKRRWFGKNKG